MTLKIEILFDEIENLTEFQQDLLKFIQSQEFKLGIEISDNLKLEVSTS